MSSAWLSVSAVVLVLAMIPLALKWLQGRMGGVLAGAPGANRVVSAVAVGPHQRVVTVEVGPESARVWLTLGVTAQTINCLHTAAVSPGTLAPGEFAGVMAKASLHNSDHFNQEQQP